MSDSEEAASELPAAGEPPAAEELNQLSRALRARGAAARAFGLHVLEPLQEAWLPAWPEGSPAAGASPAEAGEARALPSFPPQTAQGDRVPARPGSEAAPSDPTEALAGIAARAEACQACGLHAGRQRCVPGEGAAPAPILFVGEAPGEEEDREGRPFVGRSGALLTKMIGAMGFGRDEIFIANVLKCRPPQNRDPEAAEVEACRPFLEEQLALVAPEIVVALGRQAAQALLNTQAPLGRLRERVHDLGSVPLVATYHPAYLLRNPSAKRAAWSDLQLVLRTIGREAPPR